MPYVRRNAAGEINALLQAAGPDAEEYLPAHHPEVTRFLGIPPDLQTMFSILDEEFIRVLEDLIDVLIAKNVLRMTDLPEEVQSKLLIRRQLRNALPNSRLHILSDSDQGLI